MFKSAITGQLDLIKEQQQDQNNISAPAVPVLTQVVVHRPDGSQAGQSTEVGREYRP